VFCEPCANAWQSFQQPFIASTPGVPNPGAAALLGLIPGVGAMYNGQFFKGLIHVVIFAVLISITHHYPIFGLFIAAWILYQSFEAYHTALARRNGQPLPDPLGLNELGGWLNLGAATRPPYSPQPGAGPATGFAGGAGPVNPGAFTPGPASQDPAGGVYQAPFQGASAGQSQQAPYQPYQPPYGAAYTPPPPGYVDPMVPPVPPVPPLFWKRKEPIGAIILIGLGMLFLLGQMDFFNGRLFEYAWPLLLIGLGIFLIVRRIGDSQGGPK
jgi:hypothetical protein